MGETLEAAASKGKWRAQLRPWWSVPFLLLFVLGALAASVSIADVATLRCDRKARTCTITSYWATFDVSEQVIDLRDVDRLVPVTHLAENRNDHTSTTWYLYEKNGAYLEISTSDPDHADAPARFDRWRKGDGDAIFEESFSAVLFAWLSVPVFLGLGGVIWFMARWAIVDALEDRRRARIGGAPR